jgi:uncharacterized protein with von Willebrand factor type A (vWA) domain
LLPRAEWRDAVISGEKLLAAARGFANELRAAGVPVGMSQTLDFVGALGVVDIGAREDVRAASRAVHVRRQEHIAIHDELFDSYWWRTPRIGETVLPRPAKTSGQGGDGRQSPVQLLVRRTYSRDEVLRNRDFDRMTVEELREAEHLVDALAVNWPLRATRRYELHAHGTRPAPRPMLRRSIASGGELVDWVWQRRRVQTRPVTLLIDVSGSMETYGRLMLRFAHALRRVNRRTEVFVFGTRLTRVTRSMVPRNVDDALARVSADVADWSGGTRIGDCLRDFNQLWASRIGSTGGIAVVLSDGWDRGDPALVATQTARLRRNSRRLLWLNPLAGADGFEPLAAGMAAAARHVDRLLPAGSLADLEDFASLLADSHWGTQPARTNAFSSSIA